MTQGYWKKNNKKTNWPGVAEPWEPMWKTEVNGIAIASANRGRPWVCCLSPSQNLKKKKKVAHPHRGKRNVLHAPKGNQKTYCLGRTATFLLPPASLYEVQKFFVRHSYSTSYNLNNYKCKGETNDVYNTKPGDTRATSNVLYILYTW